MPYRAPPTGRVREYDLRAAAATVATGKDRKEILTWGYNGSVPGPEIRAGEGDTLRVFVENRLAQSTTVHWHGLPVVNGMDGVPHVTQPPVPTGEDFSYEFRVPVAGTYLYHSHFGLQLDRGLYGPLIVEPRREELDYDREFVLLLDDWLEGLSGDSPEAALRRLQQTPSGMMGPSMMGSSETRYPLYMINGRTASDPLTLAVRRGDRVRLRLINAGAQTVFRFAVGGHRLTVTHADGQPVEHVEVDAVRLGMGERYDAMFTADAPGAWQVSAAAESGGLGRAILRYSGTLDAAPPPDHRPAELGGRLLSYRDLRDASGSVAPRDGIFDGPDRTYRLTLSGGMGGYEWTIGGQSYPDAEPLEVREGERVRLALENQSMIAHPMHLHGHFFRVENSTGHSPLKDTVLVEPHMGRAELDFIADNPGEWLFHCHNLYHMESGMARVVSYR